MARVPKLCQVHGSSRQQRYSPSFTLPHSDISDALPTSRHRLAASASSRSKPRTVGSDLRSASSSTSWRLLAITMSFMPGLTRPVASMEPVVGSVLPLAISLSVVSSSERPKAVDAAA